MKILKPGIDHVEIVCGQIATHRPTYQKMGFEKVGERLYAGGRSELWAQGFIRVLLTEPAGPEFASTLEGKFLSAHGDGICTLAVAVEDAREAYQFTTSRGGKVAREPWSVSSDKGSVTRAEIYTPADLRYAFIERKPASGDMQKPALFIENLVADRLESPMPEKLMRIDHLTNNVGMGEMKKWVEWYKRVFEFTITRHFDIDASQTGLISDVVQSPNGLVIVPINEGTEPESQVQEFVDRFKGPGVQHLALETSGIVQTVTHLREKGFGFLSVPATYYDAVPTRVPNHHEDLNVIKGLGLLIDGDQTGYLLQLFTKEMMGPFFFEFIERKGNKGFGEGNFKALFEAIERDQVARGVLHAK